MNTEVSSCEFFSWTVVHTSIKELICNARRWPIVEISAEKRRVNSDQRSSRFTRLAVMCSCDLTSTQSRTLQRFGRLFRTGFSVESSSPTDDLSATDGGRYDGPRHVVDMQTESIQSRPRLDVLTHSLRTTETSIDRPLNEVLSSCRLLLRRTLAVPVRRLYVCRGNHDTASNFRQCKTQQCKLTTFPVNFRLYCFSLCFCLPVCSLFPIRLLVLVLAIDRLKPIGILCCSHGGYPQFSVLRCHKGTVNIHVTQFFYIVIAFPAKVFLSYFVFQLFQTQLSLTDSCFSFCIHTYPKKANFISIMSLLFIFMSVYYWLSHVYEINLM